MFSYTTKVRYSELSSKGILSPGKIMDYFQDCSTAQSESLGVGLDFMEANHCAWILASYHVEFYDFPKCDDEVIVGTLPYEMRGPFGYRNFWLMRPDGTYLAKADSLWVYMDMTAGQMVKVPEEICKIYGSEERIDMPKMKRKIKMPADMTTEEPIPIRRSDIDTNGHVNNTQYVKLGLELLPEDFLPKRLRIEFKESAYFGEDLYPQVKQEDDGWYISLNKKNGTPLATMEWL